MFEKSKYLSLLEESFPGIKTTIQRCESLGFPWLSKSFLKEEKGEILSHVGLLDYPLIIDGKRYKTAALHAICTKATHRKRGFATELIQEALKEAHHSYDFVVLFTEIPAFYERLFFHPIQEYRFHLTCKHPKGSLPLRPLSSSRDDSFFHQAFRERAPLSNHIWVQDHGTLAPFNTLFPTYPTYWSLYYCAALEGLLSFVLKDKTLHLFDVIARKIPTLDLVLKHLPEPIEEIYFYFSPDLLAQKAIAEPHLYDRGYFMVHGKWPMVKPFMVAPLSRC